MALVENVSGQCLTVSYDKVEPHVPEHQVEEALSLARQYRVDAIIGLGGGSPIGMAKAVGLEFETGRSGQPKASDSIIRGREDDDTIVDLQYPYNTSVMYDLMVLALQTNSTNVICYGHPGGNRLFPFDGITLGYHSLTHHGKRPDLLQELTIIETFYAAQFSRFLTKPAVPACLAPLSGSIAH